MYEKLFNALSLCRRAGALQWGFEAVKDAVGAGQAQLVLVAQDAAPRTLRNVRTFCQGVAPVTVLPLNQGDLLPLTRKPIGVFAVCDENLARLCKNSLCADTDQLEEGTIC